ncbi:hypothetical protein [Kitasatospora humi]|nr:hypothetical protein [Kitasatospora humi]
MPPGRAETGRRLPLSQKSARPARIRDTVLTVMLAAHHATGVAVA